MRSLVLGTRGSQLARTQAEFVRDCWLRADASLNIEIQTIQTKADRQADKPLRAMPGEGVFVKEIENALLDRKIDFAVHSLKDMPLAITKGLCFAAIIERHDPRDALAGPFRSLDEIPQKAVIGTSSLRRQSQLLFARPDLVMKDIRGNINTRLQKMDDGQYDAIVIAAAGLIRTGLDHRAGFYFDPRQMLPEPGQGALCVQARSEDRKMIDALTRLDHGPTRAAITAERAFLEDLGGGCRVPIAAWARFENESLVVDGAVVSADGQDRVAAGICGSPDEAAELGRELAKNLIGQGALALLDAQV